MGWSFKKHFSEINIDFSFLKKFLCNSLTSIDPMSEREREKNCVMNAKTLLRVIDINLN